MIPTARAVLEDCRIALADLASAPPEAERPRWFTAVVLLRTVLYTLEKVDGVAGGPEVAAAIEAHWRQLKAGKPAPPIFWYLIEEERNNLVKEYAPTPSREGLRTQVRPGTIIAGGTGSRFSAPAVVAYRAAVLDGGPFEHVPLVDVIRLAIEWLASYLDGVEARIAGRIPPAGE